MLYLFTVRKILSDSLAYPPQARQGSKLTAAASKPSLKPAQAGAKSRSPRPRQGLALRSINDQNDSAASFKQRTSLAQHQNGLASCAGRFDSDCVSTPTWKSRKELGAPRNRGIQTELPLSRCQDTAALKGAGCRDAKPSRRQADKKTGKASRAGVGCQAYPCDSV